MSMHLPEYHTNILYILLIRRKHVILFNQPKFKLVIKKQKYCVCFGSGNDFKDVRVKFMHNLS